MSQIDWSKAPEDATHHGRGDDCCYWAKQVDGKQYFINIARWDSGRWKEVTERYDVEFLTSRPKSEWTGEGLPPVGLTCEFMWNYKREGSEYVKARVLFHDGGSAVVRILEGEGKGSIRESRGGDCGAHPIFKLIRTPEQIAAEQREKSIAEMCEVTGDKITLRSAEALYDAGYRKFEIVENEE